MSVFLHEGDCLDILKTMSSDSVDSVITDPPGGISFMGKAWDSDKGGRDHWRRKAEPD
jgi:site-specific DNA-methyltransferase (adenine-specific)